MGVGDLRPISSTLPEQDARYELLKWQPVRRSTKDFTKRGGLNFDGQYLQLYARVFTRDLYQFNLRAKPATITVICLMVICLMM
jgi:hypothetical protein